MPRCGSVRSWRNAAQCHIELVPQAAPVIGEHCMFVQAHGLCVCVVFYECPLLVVFVHKLNHRRGAQWARETRWDEECVLHNFSPQCTTVHQLIR